MATITGPLCHPEGIRGYGDPDHGVVLIGIAPGHDEITHTKRPFTGASGDLLTKLLRFAQWPREQVYMTNTVCWQNNAPNETEIQDCFPRLSRELGLVRPKLIITAGAIANETITGAKRRKGSRGSVTWHPRWDAYVLDTHHPSFALQARSMSAVQDIIRDLSKIRDVLSWPSHGAGAHVTYDAVENLQHAQTILSKLPHGTPVTLDIETSNPDIENIDPYNDRLLCFAISYVREHPEGPHEYTYVFPGRIFPACVRDGSHVRAWQRDGACPKCGLPREPLQWPMTARWTFQAGQYDIAGIHQYFGVRLPLCDDTMLLSTCADERPGYHGLKNNAREWLGAGWYENDVKPFYKGKMHLLKDEVVEEYNAKDAAYTRRLVPIFTRRAQEDQTDGLYRNILVPAIDTFIDMQIRGIKVDQRVLQDLAYDEWFPRYIHMYRDLQLEAQEIGWPTDDINTNSTQQLAKLFYEILGIDITKRTKTGRPSVDKETLDRMDHPFAAKIRAYRSLDTMVDYVLAVYTHLKHDGLLHPSAFVTTTRTGRTSYRDPAMQTLPKDYTVGEDYARLREIIVPHDQSTHEILELDYNQIEVWMAWAYSKDPVLLEHLLSGDVHSATAEGAFSTTRDQWSKADWDVKRQNAKKIRFGLQYGEGAEKLASPPPVGIGGTKYEAQRFVNNFWRTYPVYRAWYDGIQREAATKGYLRAPDGGVMRFPAIMDHKELRQAVNYPIQRTSSMYNLTAMIELQPLLRPFNSRIILNIHDSLAIESDRRYRSEVLALARSVMEKPRFDGFPSVKTEAKVGDNLGKMAKVA